MEGRQAITENTHREETNLFARFPTDLMVLIFCQLDLNDLRQVKVVSKLWQTIAIRAEYEINLNQQIAHFKHSRLWQYLPMMASDENIRVFLEEEVSYKAKEEEIQFGVYCSYLHDYLRTQSGYPNWQQLSKNYIQKRIIKVLSIREKYKKPYDSVESFLRLPSEQKSEQQEILKAYQELTESFAVQNLVWTFYYRYNTQQFCLDQEINLICDPRFNRYLNGYGLVLIDGLFWWDERSLIEGLLKRFVAASRSNSTQLNAISVVLSKLTSNDWDNFLFPNKSNKLLCSRFDKFIKILKYNYSGIVVNIDNALVTKIIKTDATYLCSNILMSPIVTDRISPENLIKLASRPPSNVCEEIVAANPLLIQRFNFEMIDQLMKTQPMEFLTNFKKFFLMNEKLLRSFTQKQIRKIAHFLTEKEAADVLVSPIFLDFLNDMINKLEISERGRSDFIIRFARASYGCELAVIKSEPILKMLTDQGKRKLIRINNDVIESFQKFGISIPEEMISYDEEHGFYLYDEEGVSSETEEEGIDETTPTSHQVSDSDTDTEAKIEEITEEPVPASRINKPIPPDEAPSTIVYAPKNTKRNLLLAALVLLLMGVVVIAATGGVGAVIGVPLMVQGILFALGGLCLVGSGLSFLSFKNIRSAQSSVEHDNDDVFSSAKIYRRIANDHLPCHPERSYCDPSLRSGSPHSLGDPSQAKKQPAQDDKEYLYYKNIPRHDALRDGRDGRYAASGGATVAACRGYPEVANSSLDASFRWHDNKLPRHGEERSDEAIHGRTVQSPRLWMPASAGMTKRIEHSSFHYQQRFLANSKR